MTTQGSAFSNINGFRGEHSRPCGSSQTMFACRKCDKKCIDTRTLIEHYESHDDEFDDGFGHQRQIHQGANLLPYQRERSNPFDHRVSPSPVFHQRPQPYFSIEYLALQLQAQERNSVTNPSFFVPSQNPQNFQPRNHPVTSDSILPVDTSQFVVNQATEIPRLQLGRTMSSENAARIQLLISNQNQAPFMRSEDKKGYDETGDKRTTWYLGQLEQPIPKIIVLENHDEREE